MLQGMMGGGSGGAAASGGGPPQPPPPPPAPLTQRAFFAHLTLALVHELGASGAGGGRGTPSDDPAPDDAAVTSDGHALGVGLGAVVRAFFALHDPALQGWAHLADQIGRAHV